VRYVSLALALGLYAAGPAFSQNLENLPLVGWLRINTSANNEPGATLLRDALAALGRVDGRDIRIDFRLAEGHAERLPELADVLVRENASVILATGIHAIRAVQLATRTIPIVADDDDLLAEGLISSLPRPGGNTTGVSILATELDPKRLEILRQILPGARRIALLRDPGNSVPARLLAVADAGRVLGVELQTVDVRGPSDLGAAFASFRAGGVEAVNILASPMLMPSAKSSAGSV
jgi:putative tryptophan/tyrosine transport system substrate-binding protein